MAVTRLRQPSRTGFSLVEVLIGAAFLVIIVLSIMLLFTRSMVNNESGASYTEITNLAKSRLEEMNQLAFNSPQLTIDTGSEKSSEVYYSAAQEAWIPGSPPDDGSDPALWVSSATVRQYNNNAWEDGTLDAAEALDAATPPEFVHFKEILVQVQAGDRLGILASGRRVSLRSLISK